MRRTPRNAIRALLSFGLAAALGACAASTALVLLGATAQAAPLQAWVLGPGAYGSGADPAPIDMKSIDLAALRQRQALRQDVQYDGVFQYRGLPLGEIITHYGPPVQTDLVLLYFRNGMVVPLPFRDGSAMARLNPFIALEMAVTAQEPIQPRFPSISRHIEGYADIPQVMFSDNKLVVGERWHPDLPAQAPAAFSPWSIVDSLFGIGFAESRAYYRQFAPSPEVHKGAELYRQSCQYCHGVRKVGATFGWDFGQAIELHTYRKDPARLYFHLHDRPAERLSLEQMPVLKYISEEQTLQLWRFMKAVATTATPAYLPAR